MEYIWLLSEMMLINLILSGDNAVVIAMASKNLPQKQRSQAVWWGAVGAVVLRVLLTAAAVFLLQLPYIQLVGSILLLYMAIKLLMDDADHVQIRAASSLQSAVVTIVTADLIMSLDNVLAVAALAGKNYLLLCLGMGLSIPLIIWGSSVMLKLLQRFPILMYVGAAILGYTAGKMFLAEQMVSLWFAGSHLSFYWAVPLSFVLIVLAAGMLYRFRAE